MRSPARRAHRLGAKPAARGRRLTRVGITATGAGLASVASLSLLFAGNAQAAAAPVGLGPAASFSVLAGSTVTNTGPTTMFGDLGLDPGSAVTGAPHVLGTTHVDDAVALSAKGALVTAYNDAAGRPATQLASADLSGQSFTPGVYDASSSLLFSAGNVTLNAQGDPNAVFIFQVGSSITTGSATKVVLINGAQPCNVFWKVGASATLGTNSVFAGTVMALTTISANTGATLDGRLLAQNGAVNLDTNTITTSACAGGTTGGGGGGTTGGTTGGGGGTTGGGGGTTGGGGGTTGGGGGTTGGGSGPGTTPGKPIGSKNTTESKRRRAQEAARDRAQEAARDRAQEAARDRAQEAARHRAQEAARHRAQEAARHRAQERARHAHPRRPRNTGSFTG